jgi:hypothetical protein
MTALSSGSTSTIPCILRAQRLDGPWANAFLVCHPRLQFFDNLDLYVAVISAYFKTLGLSDDEAHELHLQYYTQYGLAVRGLARHHHIGELFNHDPSVE